MGYLEYAIIIEELSRVDGSIGIIVAAQNSLCTNHIYKFGTEAQKQKYVTPLASGKKLGCWSLTEPEAGSDAGGTRTKAVKAGDSWTIDGSKTFTTNGHYADVCVAMAVTDSTKKSHGISAFIVEKGTPGFRPGKKENKLGLRASDTSEVIFTDCKIPGDNLLGKEGEGFVNSLQILDGGRISIASLGLGMAQGAYECAVRYAKQRKQFGKAIAEFQAIQFKLADMAMEIEAARPADVQGGLAGGSRDCFGGLQRAHHAGIQHGEAVCRRSCGAGGERGGADPRRLRLHKGLPCGEILSRREVVHDRRRHQRDTAAGDCADDPGQQVTAVRADDARDASLAWTLSRCCGTLCCQARPAIIFRAFCLCFGGYSVL